MRQMSRCGLRGFPATRFEAMKDLAAKTLDGTVPSHAAIMKMPDADIVERLTEVRGIGPWTVEMLLIFRLGRPDVLPVTDYGVRKGYALTFHEACRRRRPVEAADLPKPDVLSSAGTEVGAVSFAWRAGICGGRAIWPRRTNAGGRSSLK